MEGRFFRRNLDDVIAELKAIPEQHVHFADDEPFVDARRMDELAARIEQAGIRKEYYAYCRIDTFLRNRPLMERWVRIGLRRLFFGVETVFERELKEYNKRLERAQIIQGHRLAREMGLGIFSGFIIGTDYTEKEFEEVKQFIREYEINYPSFTIWTPIPGIEEGGTNYDQVIRLQPNGRPIWTEFDLQHAVVKTRLPIEEYMREYGGLYQASFWGMEGNKAFAGPGADPTQPPQVNAHAWYMLGLVEKKEGNHEEARKHFEHCLQVGEEVLRDYPNYKKKASLQLDALFALVALGEHARAVTRADELRQENGTNPNLLYRLTRLYSLSIPAVEEARRPRPLTVPDQALQAQYCDKALSCLEQALAQGSQGFFPVTTHEDLTPIRSDPRFQQIVAKY
jgi:hypothetical protein